MVIFHSFLYVYQGGPVDSPWIPVDCVLKKFDSQMSMIMVLAFRARNFTELPMTDPAGAGIYANMTRDQWIGLREILQESPIFNGKTFGFL